MFERHGKSNDRIYNIWCGMKSRCKGTSSPLARKYYAGISYCKEWDHFPAFYDWAISNGYSSNLELDRIDPTGNYEPANCRWATRAQQMQNTRVRNIKNKTSRFRGVQRLPNLKSGLERWRANGSVNGKPRQIGVFATEEDAARAYDEWALKKYGEFSATNF